MTLGQICNHIDISKTFDFKIEISRINRNAQMDSCVIKVAVFDKSSSKQIQAIQYSSVSFFNDAFGDCGNVRSYTTNVNRDSVAVDNDYGDIIVADFNFDNKDDFAIKNNSGGNGGPEYRFYIQDTNDEFILDKFLSEKMIFFPIQINKTNHTLTTLVHANALQLTETKYKLNISTKKWKTIKSKLISAN
jgi:hypothetical protein